MHRAKRRTSLRQILGHPDGGGQRLKHIPQTIANLVHKREDLSRADTLGSRIVRNRASLPRAHVRAHRVVGYAEAPARGGLAMQHQASAGRVVLHQPWLIEEGRSHRARVVEHGRLHQTAHPAAAHLPACDRAHLHRDRRLLSDTQPSDGACLATVARQMLEQLA